MGYTPLFESLTEGSLCGRWPDIGLWPVLLSMADWRGYIDKTPNYISMVTGLPQSEVLACIARFCGPDPDSRSRAEGGARLVLIDPERSWGWKVVNIQLYRDKASGQDQVLDGRNAAKVRRYKERQKDTARHRQTPGDTHSHSNTDTHTDKKEEKRALRAPRSATATRLPEDFALTEERRGFASKEGLDPERTFANFTDYWRAKSGAAARKQNWDACWRVWCRNDRGTPNNPRKQTVTWRPPPGDGEGEAPNVQQ